jgi:cysteine-rich repeat protein
MVMAIHNSYCEECGDGHVVGREECDDGAARNADAPDACRNNCKLPACGDRIVDRGEGCDDGPLNSDAPDASCRADCTPKRCGDEILDAGEACEPPQPGVCTDLCQPAGPCTGPRPPRALCAHAHTVYCASGGAIGQLIIITLGFIGQLTALRFRRGIRGRYPGVRGDVRDRGVAGAGRRGRGPAHRGLGRGRRDENGRQLYWKR